MNQTTDKSWEHGIQQLIDIIAKPNWREADRYNDTAVTLYNACVEFWIAVRKHGTQATTITSIMYLTIWDQLLWAFISAMSGAYLTAIRAFRFVFEYAVQSCALEEKYRNLPDNDDKINAVLQDPDSTQFKSAFIERLEFLDKAEVQFAKDLYHRLSEFVHPQSKILKTFDVGSLVTFEMDPEFLKLCTGFAVEVCDILGAVLVHRYPILKQESELREIAGELGLKATTLRLAYSESSAK